MESWFYLALASAFVGGVGAFTHKVVAHRGYDVTVINIYASTISAVAIGICTYLYADFNNWLAFSTVIALLASATYFVTLVFKIGALRYIDAAVFFPIYKVVGPFIAILISLFIFSDTFSVTEYVGLGLSLLIPLLLITKAEQDRQKNLRKGIILLLGASLIGTISIALTKYGSDIADNILLFVFVGELFLALSSLVVLVQNHPRRILQAIKDKTPVSAVCFIFVMGVAQALSALTMVLSFSSGGSLAIVYTISSLYILIPILLSVLIYKEHFNIQKAVAMILAVAALALLK